MGGANRCIVYGGERRREVEQRHDFEVLALEVIGEAAGSVGRAAARRALEVQTFRNVEMLRRS